MSDSIKMKKKDFVKEHTKLIEILEHGNKKQLKAEAEEQEKELEAVTKKEAGMSRTSPGATNAVGMKRTEPGFKGIRASKLAAFRDELYSLFS